MRRIICLCFAMTVLFMSPGMASGAISRFIPRIIDYQGDLDMYGSTFIESVDTGNDSFTSKNAVVRERVTLSATGFVYHPRFMRLNLSVSAGLMHDYEIDSGDTYAWSNARSTEYELRALVLPYHPYRLELFTMRTEPDTGINGPALTSDSVIYSSGAIFRYKKKPYFVNMSYIRTSTTTHSDTSVSNSYSLSATYLKQYSRERTLDVTVFGQHADSSSSTGTKTANDYMGFSNNIKRDNLGLDSLFYYKSDSQDRENRQSVFDNIFWRQILRASLPLNFDASVSYNLEKLKFSMDNTRTSSDSKSGSFDLSHRLFSSLVSQYHLSYSASDSSQSSSSVLTNVVSETYMKTIPWGTLTLGVTGARSHTDRTGPVSLPDQPYAGLSFPGTPPLVIPSPDVDPASIRVTVKSSLPPFERVPLVENSNYFVDVGPTGLYRVNIVFLPPGFPPTGTFDFFLSYTLTSGSFISDATTLSYHSEVALFKRLLTFYYNHSSFTNSISGDAIGQPLDNVTDLFGLHAQKWGASLTLEYQKVRSGDQLAKTSRALLEYRKFMEPSLTLYAGATYENTDYPQGTLASPGLAYSDKLLQGMASVSKGFLRNMVFFTLGGSYQTRSGLTDSSSYGMNSTLQLRLGKTYLAMGASMSSSETNFPSSGVSEKRFFQYYYLNMKRELF